MTDAVFKFLPLGAIIQSFKVKDTNIVLGFPEQEHYVKYNTAYFGETIGRVANRIKDARIESLNGGKSYALAANDGFNHLHGGNEGWGKRIWRGPTPVGTRQIPGVDGLRGGESVEFTLRSEDGDEGYPGTVEAKVVYTTGSQVVNGNEAFVLGIEYEARLVGGADETVPSFQFYTGDLTNVPAAEGLPARGPRSAFCCEPGRWINACNVPEWKNMVLLKKGETYGARIVYRAWTE
ncbi:galactose mutarotase-like protein [Trichoderma longibrachiatum ATCC 18648]|uniref:Galactose mutarotase-like protein n=1 Tax=Trichoderma longibrachiatum ATCC 18648 TaxID=983965 RepID=A0A2T4C7D7_TRILO|nr:galactose mutarotase-like protein [Trichoderma longibrachiatum ATCC 18648]